MPVLTCVRRCTGIGGRCNHCVRGLATDRLHSHPILQKILVRPPYFLTLLFNISGRWICCHYSEPHREWQ